MQRFTNRLIKEKSPYLLQHAHNPVDWYPWGEEAFKAAHQKDCPIFLSIGYSTCHWCHVMERECFSNEHVAELLNENFINIKVDREELPEVDAVYMELAQTLMAGVTGWPLNIVLTPDLEPFYAATYLPPVPQAGLTSFPEMVDHVKSIWEESDREEIDSQAKELVTIVNSLVQERGNDLPTADHPFVVATSYFKIADPVNGGVRGVPKFPIGYQIYYLLTYAATSKDGRATFLAERTLESLALGGIYDQLGGGFSRYAVDEEWKIPHFEKMLYDNAFLIEGFLYGWQIFKSELFHRVAKESADYVLREMQHSEGGFYVGQDAETHEQEGLYYTWTAEEIEKILPKKELKIFSQYYQATSMGNFHGRNILWPLTTEEEFADMRSLTLEELRKRLSNCRQLLFTERCKRTQPFIDDKIMSGWNGLMIHSMALVGRILREPHYTESALKAIRFLKEHLWIDGHLLRRWRDGESKFNGGLEEYANLIRASLTLFESDCGSEWLTWAIELSNVLESEFKAEHGCFYQTKHDEPYVLIRRVHMVDGAEPSGNAIHCENLLRLYQITRDSHYLTEAEDILRSVRKNLDKYPPGYLYHAINIDRYFNSPRAAIIIALNEKNEGAEEIKQFLSQCFIPFVTVTFIRPQDDSLFECAPKLRDYTPIKDKTTLYVIQNNLKEKPIDDLTQILERIRKL